MFSRGEGVLKFVHPFFCLPIGDCVSRQHQSVSEGRVLQSFACSPYLAYFLRLDLGNPITSPCCVLT